MKDLSTVKNSMAFVIQNNHSVLDACTQTSDLVDCLKNLFSENKINTQASNRLILNVSRCHSCNAGLQTIYNSLLAGSNLKTF